MLERDGRICYLCGAPDSTTVDHEVPKFKGGTDDESNLRACCVDCHKKKATREGQEALRLKQQGGRPC